MWPNNLYIDGVLELLLGHYHVDACTKRPYYAATFRNECRRIERSFVQISLNYIPNGLIENNSALLQVMAWCRQARGYCLRFGWPRSMAS